MLFMARLLSGLPFQSGKETVYCQVCCGTASALAIEKASLLPAAKASGTLLPAAQPGSKESVTAAPRKEQRREVLSLRIRVNSFQVVIEEFLHIMIIAVKRGKLNTRGPAAAAIQS